MVQEKSYMEYLVYNTSKDGDSNKTHFPTLIYPNPFGEINEVDRAFGELTFEEILDEIEKLS